MSTLENKYQSTQFKVIDKRIERSPDGYTYYTFSPVDKENLVMEVKMRNSFECIRNDRKAIRMLMVECYDKWVRGQCEMGIEIGDVI